MSHAPFLENSIVEAYVASWIEIQISHLPLDVYKRQEYCRQEVKDWRLHPSLTDEEWGRITMPMVLIAGENR